MLNMYVWIKNQDTHSEPYWSSPMYMEGILVKFKQAFLCLKAYIYLLLSICMFSTPFPNKRKSILKEIILTNNFGVKDITDKVNQLLTNDSVHIGGVNSFTSYFK